MFIINKSYNEQICEKPSNAVKTVMKSFPFYVSDFVAPICTQYLKKENITTKKMQPIEEEISEKQNDATAKRKTSTKEDSKENKRKRESDVTEERETQEENDRSETSNDQSEGDAAILKTPKTRHDRGIGKVMAWGQNDSGQIGCNSEVELKRFPALVHFFKQNEIFAQEVCAGGLHTVVLTSIGEVYTFGCNDEKALGRIADEDEWCTPGKINLTQKVVQISAGDSHGCALTEEGQVYAWGTFRDGNGSIGLIPCSFEPQVNPQELLSTDFNTTTHNRIVQISSGANHIAMLSQDGVVYTLGAGDHGQLGRVYISRVTRSQTEKITEREFWLTPQAVPVKVNLDGIWTGDYSTYGRAETNGDIFVFGLNNHNQLGIQKRGDNPEHVIIQKARKSVGFKGNQWEQIAAGEHHCVALTTGGKVYSVGRQDDGRLGLGPSAKNSNGVLTLVPKLANEKCVQVACGLSQGYAVTDEGRLYSWGFGENYQLGTGEDSDSYDPVLCEGPKQRLLDYKVIFVSGGGQHTTMLANPIAENSTAPKNKVDNSVESPSPTDIESQNDTNDVALSM